MRRPRYSAASGLVENSTMADCAEEHVYVGIDQLVAITGLPRSTIWRLKRQGKIPFFQPGGPGHRVLFPRDAIEHADLHVESIRKETPPGKPSPLDKQLPGPQPAWMSVAVNFGKGSSS